MCFPQSILSFHTVAPASCETSIHSVILGIFEQIQKHYETKEKQDILTLSTGY